ncbi:DNA glycosylase/AP lyase ROS1-like [Bidens hawaiensis]|uniref:DNA glycosylase/AP lyase ROS1-like n=1 Tax=Bidens hawaiensis TaxID=980011 RepID=UPI00404A399A
MDERGESSFYLPVTPDKPGRPDPNPICKNWLENPFDEAVFEEASFFGSTGQSYDATGGMCNMFSMDDVETWNNISCRDLLALADASIEKASYYGGGGVDGGWLNLSLCDLNLPPQAVAEPLVNTGLSLKFMPVTPDPTKTASDMVTGNEDERVNETAQPKPKRRKHRPKVVTEGKPKRERKAATPKTEGASTGKRKYVRRNGVEKSTETPEETSGVIHPSPDQESKKTCKRKLEFDESDKQADASHVTVEKTCIVVSEEVENEQKVHETKSVNPITPSKTELPQGRLKRKYTKAKCKINFLQETRKSYAGYNNPNLRCESIHDINVLMNRFERLHINDEKNALVVYQQDRTLVPYEGLFNPTKKRKRRPKVDLDEETNRVWMLLLENINSEGIDGTDEDKAKWWEEERRVFRGRVDSFIARMHLVQGDRRLSKWKGSVLDSVVGVFLTQNVSDHLSSSAFMSLAARYPLKPNTASSEPLHDEESCVDLNDNSEYVVAELTEKDSEICKESVVSHIEVDEIVSSQNSADTCSVHESEERKESGECASFVELLRMLGPSTVYKSETIRKNSGKCISEESGISSESASQTAVQIQESANGNLNRSNQIVNGADAGCSKVKNKKTAKTQIKVDWDKLRLQAEVEQKRERTPNTMDSMDYEAIRAANVNDVADAIKERGMNNRLAARIKDMLDRVVEDHGSIDLEWLRDVPPDKAKEYLLSFKGLGLKSVECIRLLTLHHLAFPVDTNVGRIAVRLGWVPLQPLPESLQLHLLELYPIQETIQKYLWPRLCKLDQKTLYELHYQMITFGKVFCTKTKPNCNACPLRAECRHFASAFASARLTLPAPEESIAGLTENKAGQNPIGMIDLPSSSEQPKQQSEVQNCNIVIEEPTTPGPIVEVPASAEPIVEVPESPEPEELQQEVFDMEDFNEDTEEIPMIKLNIEQFTQNLQTYMESHMELVEGDMSKALVALTSEAASIPTPKLKNVSNLRTEHQVYELPDSHPLLEGLDIREHDDLSPYLLAIWTPGETANSIQPPEGQCCSQESGTLCNEETCFFCNSTREANSQTVRGTLLIPCRTAMRGSFPLNGTYFQVNEVFADHESSLNPIDVPRAWLWNLPRRTVYFGTSIPTIFKGLTTEDIQYCFWKGFVCVRGFDQKTRAPRPLMARLHFPASRLNKSKPKTDEKEKLKQ